MTTHKTIYKPHHIAASLGLAIGLGCLSAPVHAADGNASLQIEEVLVTARKRAESAQDVPISVTAITDALQDSSVQSFLDLEGLAPNVQIREGMMRAGGASITIRGIGYFDDEKSLDSPVGVLIDGIYMGFTTGQLLDNFDLESVEILRGPQGTLYGKNTIGGVVSATRSKPTGEFGGKVSWGGGSFGRNNLKAIFNAPIIEDVLAAKLFVASVTNDGDKYNTTLKKDVNKQDYLNYGGAFLFTPNENLEVLLTVETFDDGSDNGAPANFNGLSVDESQYNLDGQFGPMEYNPPAPYISINNLYWTEQTSHELRMNVSTDKADIVLGYYHWESEYTQDWVTADLWPHLVPALLPVLCGEDGSGCPLTGGFGQRIFQSQKNKAEALFAQVDYRLTDQVELSAGFRYTEEVKKFFGQEGVFVPDNIRNDALWTASEHFDPYKVEELTWKLGLSYKLNDDIMIYSSAAKGFHSGGYYGKNQKLSDFANTYEPEFNTSLELGVKAELMDGRIRINAAVFESTLKGKQETAQVPDPRTNSVVTIMTNVGQVTYKGFEAEVQALITENWDVGLTLGILDAEYDKFFVDINGVNAAGELEPTDNTYLKPKMAADGNYSLRTSYDFDVAGGEATASASYAWSDEFFTRIQNNPVSLVPAMGKINASLGYKRNGFGISIYGNNLTDKQYANVWVVGPLTTFGQWTQGRSYGVTVNKEF